MHSATRDKDSQDHSLSYAVVTTQLYELPIACFINSSLKGRGFSRRDPQRVPLLHGLGWKPRRPEPEKLWALAPGGD